MQWNESYMCVVYHEKVVRGNVEKKKTIQSGLFFYSLTLEFESLDVSEDSLPPVSDELFVGSLDGSEGSSVTSGSGIVSSVLVSVSFSVSEFVSLVFEFSETPPVEPSDEDSLPEELDPDEALLPALNP